MTTLGLDISSSVVGYSITDSESQIIRYGFIDISRIDGIIEKCECFVDFLDFSNVDKIIIEESLKSFAFGRTSTNTIILLAKMNATATFAIYKKTGIKPIHINATTARKNVGIKIEKKAERSTKEQVFDFITKSNDLVWVYNKKDEVDKRCFDIADAIIISKSLSSRSP